ncbi:hypothetical protein [Streptomyces osmaniensis]|uniref:Uncharacterized protein n=1 Tax=Streptomyces osmaniensis TaxID=593134 RepID=A0ABP6YUR3_9ACTN|nr:hypothetical protein KJK32_46890 [Streptomyces sp. JCM17656]
MTTTVVSDAERLLTAHHRPVTRDDYGKTIVAGFAVTGGLGGTARVSHATPQPDLMDPERPSDDELAEARHQMVNAYAQTLAEAGWSRVERRGANSRYPYLLASGAPQEASGRGVCGRTEAVSGTTYPPCVREADHREAFCRSAAGDLFLAPCTGRP